MSRTVSSNHATGESFEGLLDRLTRRASSADSPANFDSVSASGAGAAASQGSRRRALAPVAEVKPRGSKPAGESMPLSYENALRIHARRSLVADTDLRNPDLRNSDLRNSDLRNSRGGEAKPEGPRTGVARASDEQVGRSGSIPPNQRPEGGPAPAALTASAERASQLANQVRNQVTRKNQETGPVGKRAAKSRRGSNGAGTTGRGTPQASIGTVGTRTTAPAVQRASAVARPQIKASAPEELHGGSRTAARKKPPVRPLAMRSPAKPAHHAKHGGEAKMPAPVVQSTRQPARRERMQTEELGLEVQELGLEVQRANLQLEHRNAVVSIRLNDAEVDRLRQRAAESGISVSAYMRSCVLDAEHLRTQVKQALAEMRASMQPMPSSMNPAPQPSHLAMLSSTGSDAGSGEGSGWSRLLWKSATLLLGPWFFFRHRA
jgi:predicted DNA binding CopG/RHH family protein